MSDDLIQNLRKLTEVHEKQLSEIRAKLHLLDAVPKAQALVGKCFKYPNSYSFGSKNGWVYEEVIAADNGNVFVNKFCTEVSRGAAIKVEFHFAVSDYPGHFVHTAVIPISKKTYDREFKKLLKTINKLNDTEF